MIRERGVVFANVEGDPQHRGSRKRVVGGIEESTFRRGKSQRYIWEVRGMAIMLRRSITISKFGVVVVGVEE